MKSSSRTRKLGENVREALADILLEEVSDPRLALVTITSVDVSPDMRVANVYVTTHGDIERYKAMLEGLESAKRRIRAELAKRVRMKYMPELRFFVDSSVDEGMRIQRALDEERERVEEIEAMRPPGSEDQESPYRDDKRHEHDD